MPRARRSSWRNSGLLAIAIAIAVAVAVLAAAVLAGGDAADRGVERRSVEPYPVAANLWVATAAGGSPRRCRTPCGFDAALAYDSFDTAYAASRPGDLILVKGGTYPAQLVNKSTANRKAVGSARVTFRPAKGETVSIANGGSFTSTANDVNYHGVKLATGASDDGSNGVSGGQIDHKAGQNVLYEGFSASVMGGAWTADQATTDAPRNVTFRGNDIGPFSSCGGGSPLVNADDGPDDYVVEDSFFHDYTIRDECPTAHLDCLHTFNDLDGVTIRRNRFRNCFGFGVLVNGASDVNIENNFFQGTAIYGFKLRGDNDPDIEVFNDVTIRFNSSDTIDLGSDGANTLRDVVVQNNVTVDGITCRSGVTYGGNLSESANGCSGDDHPPAGAGGLSFTDATKADFHVGPSSPVLGAAFGSAAPRTDIDGDPRPRSGADVGADERP